MTHCGSASTCRAASIISNRSLQTPQLPDGVSDDAPYQPFVLAGNPNRSIVPVAGHQPDLPVVVHLDVFHGETFGGDAYGKIAPPGFEYPVHDHRVAVLDVVVDQGDAPHLPEEGADRVGNQLFGQVDEPLDGPIPMPVCSIPARRTSRRRTACGSSATSRTITGTASSLRTNSSARYPSRPRCSGRFSGRRWTT